MTELGAKVTAPKCILRRTVWGTNSRAHRKEWYAPEWMKKSVSGIYIGHRTYANGTVTWDEDGHSFRADEWIKVALIVENERQKPVPVLFLEMEEIEENQ